MLNIDFILGFLCVTISVVLVSSADPKIVGGANALPDQIKYQVSLKYQGNHRCGGTIVNLRHVVTAGHCVVGEKSKLLSAGQLRVDVGTIAISGQGGVSHSVEKIHLPKGYSTNPMTHDIAVLRIKGKFNFTKSVQPLNISSSSYLPGTMCTISGWGTTREGSSILPANLIYASVPIIDVMTCQSMISSSVEYDMLCAGYPAGGVDSCQGDSGGPLQCGNSLTGVVSYGYGCAQRGKPGIYTDVHYHNKWISDILKSSSLVVMPFTSLIFTIFIFILCV